MDVANLIIGLASIALSIWALRTATTANRAIMRFQSLSRRVDCLLKLQQAIAIVQRLLASRGRNLSQQDLDQLRRLLTEVRSSQEITGQADRDLQFAIAQVRVVPDNTSHAKHELRKVEEDMLSISTSLRDSIEDSMK
jgi:hypothetical protein